MVQIKMDFSETQSRKLRLISAVEDIDIQEYCNKIINTHLDSMSSEEIIKGVKSLFNETKPIKTPKQRRKRHSPSDPYEFTNFDKTPYFNLQLSRCDFFAKGENRSKKLALGVNEALLIQTIDKLTYSDIDNLSEQFNVSKPTLTRFIWNIKEGFLDDTITEFLSKMDKVEFTKKNGKIYINNESTFEVNTVRVLLASFNNSLMKKEERIWKLIQTHPYSDKLHITLICENSNNKKLLNLLKEEKSVPIVNNREKRQNLIMNGGI